MPEPDDEVWVAITALTRPPHTMAHHDPGRETEWGTASRCFYHHEWVEMRRDVAETFTRYCHPCAAKQRRTEARATRVTA